MRRGTSERLSNETEITVQVDLDGGNVKIETGVGFFDHMLTLFAFQARIGLEIKAKGDLWIDAHHTVEDTAIGLGIALTEALGAKAGIERYGEARVPMDETLASVVLDFSGRPFTVFKADFKNPKLGDFDTELAEEFFQGLSRSARMTIHAEVMYGSNTHHMIEGLFKALGRAVRQAVAVTGQGVPSTKGLIDG
ncbi:imidazoleglycerol-phosphate dehydratase HisB [Exiguobacterium flavidum]|uniref:imidazoleglycerol-phosphate dehydratase HisB n=1 Tax=Exiguobacterium flavidum TaxID=2184695 RepID=UPI000DF7B127|nr:imidazoleglycerol-phosphate dehydratase HisB [Exiguobacterium flavidum]